MSAKLRIGIESSSRLLFVGAASQVFLTTSSIGLWIQTLKFWSLPRIVAGPATGWAGLNWSPKADACGSAWLRRVCRTWHESSRVKVPVQPCLPLKEF